jgi:hypothetical protein
MAVHANDNHAAGQYLKVARIGDMIQDQVWHSVRQRAIIPAWRSCRDRLEQCGRKTHVQERPHTDEVLSVLLWRGRDALDGHLIGLQFSPADSGSTLCFDLSVVREDTKCRYQASLYREHFSISEPDLIEKVARSCDFAMGIASATEKPPLESVVWKHRRLRPERLC